MFTVIPNYSDVPRTQGVQMSVRTSDEKLNKDEDNMKYEEEDKFKDENAYKDESKDEEEERDVRLEVEVGKWFLNITVDGQKVMQKTMNHSDVGRMRKGGLYLTVLHPSTFIVMHTSRHRTFEMSGDMELLRVLKGVQPGRIVVLAAMNEGFQQLSDLTISWLFNIGSLAIPDMTTGDRWACVWTQGGRVWAEGTSWVDFTQNKNIYTTYNKDNIEKKQIKKDYNEEKQIKKDKIEEKQIKKDYNEEKQIKKDYNEEKQIKKDYNEEKQIKKGYTEKNNINNNKYSKNINTVLDHLKFVIQGGPVRLSLVLPRVAVRASECVEWPKWGVWAARRRFCDRYEGYWYLCSCTNPEVLPSVPHSPPPHEGQPHSLKQSLLSPHYSLTKSEGRIPTVVVASQRPLCLYWCLRRLMGVVGSDPRLTLVVADGDTESGLREVRELVNLFGIKYVDHDSGGREVTKRITRHYRFVLDTVFITFPTAPAAIILEEDLYVSGDFYRYFSQIAPLLLNDPTLYCVSAWNDLSRQNSRGDPAVVMRSQTMAGLGWMLSREVYQEVIQKWPAWDKFADWDMWLRLPELQRGRECLVPEVSRTFHFGSTGAHLTAHFYAKYYSHASFNVQPDVDLKGLDMLGPESYDVYLRGVVAKAAHMDGANANPCSTSFLPRNSCLGLWNLDVRGHHRLLWRLKWKGTPLLIIAYPASPFSTLKTKEVNVMVRYNPNKSSASISP
ncbi:hypothetical protein Pmani_027344 [Petrolisthes manimaculis]|uniref:ILEI/PANDER domain-containing protein n=1 Tax=Petrolisthes manimaculis TaxID=1843537 RepID=A0AAE1P1U1_9EUCA|nr:hypothetical protein Pmani_027344 [Petrolisthes manimaculis]